MTDVRLWTFAVFAVVAGLGVVGCPFDVGSLTGGTEPNPEAGAADATVSAETGVGGADAGTSGCAPGLLPGPDGGCAPTCGGLTCAAHETCDPGATPPACICVVAYARAGGQGPCVFAGGPADPGFQNTPLAWQVEPTVDGGVSVVPTADGGLDPGALVFDNSCKPALAKQTFAMPPYAAAEPVALELNIKGSGASMPIEVLVAGRTFPVILAGSGYSTVRVCLGESAYGGDVEVGFRRTNQCGSWSVDRATVVPDPSCLVAGAVASGDFQTPNVWLTSGGAGTTTAGLAGISGRLAADDPCPVPRLTGKMHVPLSMARPALAVSYQGTAGVYADLGLSGGRFQSGGPPTIPSLPFGRLVGTGAFERVNVCLPEWARGTIRALDVSMPARGTDCAQASAAEFLVDDFTVVEDPSCDAAGTLFDTGFEGAKAGAKVLYVRGSKKTNVDFGSTFPKLTGAGLLHVKSSYVDCSTVYSSTETGSMFASGPRPPTSTSPGAPRATFSYIAGANGTSLAAGQTLAPAPTKTPGSICLPRSLAGQGFTLDFAVTMGCPSSSSDLYVDDVALAWDPTCP